MLNVPMPTMDWASAIRTACEQFPVIADRATGQRREPLPDERHQMSVRSTGVPFHSRASNVAAIGEPAA